MAVSPTEPKSRCLPYALYGLAFAHDASLKQCPLHSNVSVLANNSIESTDFKPWYES